MTEVLLWRLSRAVDSKKFSPIIGLVMLLWPSFFKDEQDSGKKGFKPKTKIRQSDWSTFLWKLPRAVNSKKFSQIVGLVMFLWPFFFKDEQKSGEKRVKTKNPGKWLKYFSMETVKSCRLKKIQPNPRVSYVFMAIFL